MKGPVSRSVLPLLAVLLLLAPGVAHAYLDPGSVSLFFQAAIAAALGGLLVLRRYWHQVVDGVRRLFSRSANEDD